MTAKVINLREIEEISGREEDSPNSNACGDHHLPQSESGVELKSLLKLIDNAIELEPATDDGFESTLLDNSSLFHRGASSRFCNEPKVTLTEILMVPVEKYPKYNFVGRILGPKGMTVKQLEKETGCRIFVRGRASSNTFNPHTKTTRMFHSKTSLSTISQSALTEEPLHVFIECYDFASSASRKMAHAVLVINELLSPPADGKDELKRQQLVDISLINGTYRATNSSKDVIRQTRGSQWVQTVDPTSNAVDLELKSLKPDSGHGDLGSVYGIAQQKRVWQKPRGLDASSEEYAKSVSSREYVSDIVNKTKQSSPVKKAPDDESLINLPQSVVSETLKVAKNLLASHQMMSLGLPKQDGKAVSAKFGAGDCQKGDRPFPLMSSLPPPPFNYYFPPPGYPDYPMPNIYYMMPPPHFPTPKF